MTSSTTGTSGTTDSTDTTADSGRLSALRGLGCTDLSDAMDRLGIPGQCLGIAPQTSTADLVGRAFTVRYGPVGQSRGSVGDYIDELGEGDVVVLDNQGRLDATVWGDLLTLTASRNHVGGTVIDGVCRDTDRAGELGYPIHARGTWMRTGKDRVQVEELGGAVSVGGVRVEAGDWLRGDGDGVVAIPAGRVDEVVEVARGIAAAEARIREAVLAGSDLREARAAVGYHDLQTRRRDEA